MEKCFECECLTDETRGDQTTISSDRYAELVEAETRLSILFNMRKTEILNIENYTYKHPEDYVLSDKLDFYWQERERLLSQKKLKGAENE